MSAQASDYNGALAELLVLIMRMLERKGRRVERRKRRKDPHFTPTKDVVPNWTQAVMCPGKSCETSWMVLFWVGSERGAAEWDERDGFERWVAASRLTLEAEIADGRGGIRDGWREQSSVSRGETETRARTTHLSTSGRCRCFAQFPRTCRTCQGRRRVLRCC